MTALTRLIQHGTEFRQHNKERKGTSIRMEEMKLLLFADGMLYIENLKEYFFKTLLEQITPK